MNALLIICLYGFLLYVPNKHALHMLQQNRYRPMRYLSWMKQTIKQPKKKSIQRLLAACSCWGLFLLQEGEELTASLLYLLVLIYAYLLCRMEQQETYRKPLVWTPRARRLCSVLLLLELLLLLVFLSFPIHVQILLSPCLLLAPWLVLLPACLCTLPLEQLIQRRYQKKAEKILRGMSELQIIGISGSYGKTSLKQILYHLLSSQYMTLMTPQSYNNAMGITLTIRNELKALHEVFLCEMGADHVHDIEKLMRFVKPGMSVVTAIGPQHLQTFHSMVNIQREKMQMIEQLPMDGIGFLNIDSGWIRNWHIKNRCTIIWYGCHPKADYYAHSIHYQEETTFCIRYHKKDHLFRTKLLGEHNISNITAAVAIAHTMGIPFSALQRAVRTLPFIEHRLQKREAKDHTILDDAYNANPQGARYALEVLRQRKGKRILVTPGMIDLGAQQDRENEELGAYAASCADEVILVGEGQTRPIKKGLLRHGMKEERIHTAQSFAQALTILEGIKESGCTILFENDLPDAFHH